MNHFCVAEFWKYIGYITLCIHIKLREEKTDKVAVEIYSNLNKEVVVMVESKEEGGSTDSDR